MVGVAEVKEIKDIKEPDISTMFMLMDNAECATLDVEAILDSGMHRNLNTVEFGFYLAVTVDGARLRSLAWAHLD